MAESVHQSKKEVSNKSQKSPEQGNIVETEQAPQLNPHNLALNPQSVMQLQSTIGNSATARMVRQKQTPSEPIQAKLEVGAADDVYEHEADQVANSVMASLHSGDPTSGESKPARMGLLQRIMRMGGGGSKSDTVGGTEASPQVTSGIQQARGGGKSLDQGVKSRMEGAFGTSFSNVRIHDNGDSDRLSRSLDARAFTTGADIFFKRGEYNPDSTSGQHLLAHELTHVVQQSGSINRMMIQRALDTSGGTWSHNEYKTVVEDGKPGAEIELHFTPNKLVESKKVALVQKVKKIHNGVNLDAQKKQQEKDGTLFGNASKTASNRTTDTGDGHWDRSLEMTNPVYGAKNLGAGKDVSETPSSTFDMTNKDLAKRSNYQLGHRYNTWFGLQNNVRDAILWDKPNQPSAGPGTEMIFEVSAMSISGAQKGTFYGSVEWGFKITGTQDAPQNDIIPFTVISEGTPSANMMELAEVWNNKPTVTRDGDVTNTQMLTTQYQSLANTIDLTDATQVGNAIQTIEGQLKNLKGTDLKNANFELKFLKTKLKNLQDG